MNGGVGWLGMLPTPMHMHAHIHVKHDNFNCKWQQPLGESLGIPYNVICMHMHVCACVWGAPFYHPTPKSTHTSTPMGGPGISQNSITLELIKIFQFCLKIWNLWRLPHHGWVYGFSGWVNGWVQVKSLKIE